MEKDPKVFLGHILESIDAIETYTKGLSYEDFCVDIKIQDAIVRRFEIIGEAVVNLSESLKAMNPNIPWRQITAMRNNLIHEYFTVDEKLVWNAITNDVPVFKEKIGQLLKSL